jgi:hypothetical protein
VFAQPSIPGGKLRVVSAWLAPGVTTFTVDGPLPSDGKGRLLSLAAAVFACACLVVWGRRRWRDRVLRAVARVRARGRRLRWGASAVRVGVPVVLVVLVTRGVIDVRRPARDLEVGNGLRGTVDVSARELGGEWVDCDYERVTGTYACDGLVTVTDGMASLLNDAPPSWAFNTPSINAMPEAGDVELRIRTRARLAGLYWAAASGGTVELDVERSAPRTLTRDRLEYEDLGERAIELRATLPYSAYGWSFTFVREDTLLPDRSFMVTPPDDAPASVRAIH